MTVIMVLQLIVKMLAECGVNFSVDSSNENAIVVTLLGSGITIVIKGKE